MQSDLYIFKSDLDWPLILSISEIDRFDAAWTAIERREKQNLKQLKTIATIRSVGASTRIEGSKLTDEEVNTILKNIDIAKLEDRDSQEVVGYFEALDLISDSYDAIDLTEGNIKNLHNVLMKFSSKDNWHKGNFKTHSNAVQATYSDGNNQVIFDTTEPGSATEIAIHNLLNWIEEENVVHPIIKCSVFVYEFLSIHPFQDGNGRLSRLLTSLFLLKNGYKWIEYVSFEHEIENRKSEYYRVLRNCQSKRPGENITEWVSFFLDALKNVQKVLLQKLSLHEMENTKLLPREKIVLGFIQNHPGCKSGNVVKALGISRNIILKELSGLIEKNLIEKHGTGSATQYSIL